MFKVDAAAFEQMKLNGTTALRQPKRRNHLLQDREVATQILQSTLRKFCNLCTHFNVDVMTIHALPLAILLSSKTKHRLHLAQQYADAFNLDVHAEDGGEGAKEAMQTVSDWCTVLQYLNVDTQTAIAPNSIQHKLRDSLLAVGLSVGDDAAHLLNKLVVHIAIRNTPTPRMLETFLGKLFPSERDIPFKAMKLSTLIWDTVYEEDSFHEALLTLCRQSSPSEQWVHDIMKIVQDQNFMSTTVVEVARNTGRPKLRLLAREVHVEAHSSAPSTFRSWCSQCGFPSTTSTQLQRLLYFVRVQNVAVPESLYAHLFTTDVLDKSEHITIDRIDLEPVKTNIASLRVYRNNVKDLIDFRSKCLVGLSLQTRNKLSLAKVLQLYASAYQHDSVWEECWKTVVPVMNHTIATSRARFCENHPFDISSVIANMILCQLGTDNAVQQTDVDA